MTEERRRVLDMLAEGKITAEEAERLLKALKGDEPRTFGEALKKGVESFGEVFEKGVESFGETFGKGFEETFGEAVAPFDERKRNDTFAVGDKPRLVVHSFNGRVRVYAGEPGSIRVRARLKNPHGVEYRAVQEGDLVEVAAKPTDRHAGASIEVVVPVATSVDLATSNGPVELRGTEGGGAVQTTNGRIRVEQCKGELNATTTNASIALKTFQGAAELATTNSRLSIEDARGRFDAQTTNGAIAFQGRLEPESHNRLATSNGNIRVALDAEPSLKLTATTVNGRVRCEVPGFAAAVDTGQKLEGTVGAGEAELIAETKNGAIVVHNE